MKDCYFLLIPPKAIDFDSLIAIEAELMKIEERIDHRENFEHIPFYRQLLKLDKREMARLEYQKAVIISRYLE